MKVYPSHVASETLPTEERVVLDHDVAGEPEGSTRFYILEEELILAEKTMIPPFEDLLDRARLENASLLSQTAKQKDRLETVTAMFCCVLRLDPINRPRPAAEVACELRRYAAHQAPREVHPWRWLLGLESRVVWDEARLACPGTTEQDLEAQFMLTWATAPPRLGDPFSEAYALAKECPVRTRLERPQTYLDGISILYWMQRLMDLCGEPWNISGKDFGKLIDLKQPTASVYLKLAQEDGLLEKTCSLTPATAYVNRESYSYRFHVDQVAINTSDTRDFSEARRHGTMSVVLSSSLVLVNEEVGDGSEVETGSVPKTTVPQARARRKRERQRKATPWLDRKARLRMILSKLEEVARCGKEHKARCPVHKSKKQNLTIGAGREGVVLRCHAGCETRDIVAAIGLQMSDLYWDPPA